jgi:hypothetical protein
VSSGEVDVSQTPVISNQKSQRQYLADNPKILLSDYQDGAKQIRLSKKIDKKSMNRNNGLSKSIDTMSKEEILKQQHSEQLNTLEKQDGRNRRRQVYSNDIYGFAVNESGQMGSSTK